MPLESRKLASAAASAAFSDLPGSIVGEAVRATLDWLGSALAGAAEPPARMVQRAVASFGTSDESTVFGAPRASAAGAALANGVASHILELDDLHKGSTLHAAAAVIPAALAVAERERASGEGFLLAVVVGYDVAIRVGEAVNPSHYRFWHPTGTAATFGAAAAAGSLMNLSPDRMLDAMGTAGTQAAGLWEFNADGAMSKHLHPGKAAFNGVLAADLARAGFTGAAAILEGERGFFRATTDAFDASRVTDGLGERWKIGENAYKIWSCCGHTHTAIDVAAELRRHQGWTSSEAASVIESIDITTYGAGYGIVKQPNPSTPYQARFSIAYVTAAALLTGGANLDVFDPAHFGADGVTNAALASLLQRTRVNVSADLTSMYPRAWPARVKLTFRDGSTAEGFAEHAAGNPENPVSTERLEAKFRDMVAPRYGTSLAEASLAAVARIRHTRDMSTTFRDLLPA